MYHNSIYPESENKRLTERRKAIKSYKVSDLPKKQYCYDCLKADNIINCQDCKKPFCSDCIMNKVCYNCLEKKSIFRCCVYH